MSIFEITGLAKAGGILSKRIALSDGGSVRSDGSACRMTNGGALRLTFNTDNLQAFADCIANLEPHEAIALGALRDGLPDEVQIVTKAKLNNGTAHPSNAVIARTSDAITFRSDRGAVVLLDCDLKSVPSEVQTRIEACGGLWAALASVIPALMRVGHIVRRSTSAGLYRTDTGERLPGSENRHFYIPVVDGSDIPRFLKTLHDRLWLDSLGWMEISRSGQRLERSLIDYTVRSPERLVFEGAPVLEPSLAQDLASRTPTVTEGPELDTRAACPELTVVEHARLHMLQDTEKHRLRGEVEAVPALLTKEYSETTGCIIAKARHVIERRLTGVLLPDAALEFDDPDLDTRAVAEVLADPDRFVGETLADPLEGVAYGRCKAKIMRRPDGSLWIHSFAHGRSTYELRHNKASVEATVRAAPDQERVDLFVRLLLMADVSAIEEHELRTLVCQLTGTPTRPLDATVKAAREELKQQQLEGERQRRAAERTDPRPQVGAPFADAPWLPEMAVINEVLAASQAAEPPMRDLDGTLISVRSRRIADLHTLTALGANQEESPDIRLPPPEELLLTRLGEIETAELLEHHIDYVDEFGNSVHLRSPFVRHYLVRHDEVLPVATAVTTLPLVLPDGQILSGHGLDREYRTVLRVPEQIDRVVPRVADCSPEAAVEAMRFLADEWLRDVATGYAGKCVAIALALSIMERAILPERPAFMVSAGQRSSGKTTLINMVSTAVLGHRAAAAAWSTDENERRKALLAYFREALPLLAWDNITRGAAISCPSIEKALTAAVYQDRVLGETQICTVFPTTIQVFTGNNITPRGDMVSRSLPLRLSVDRADPENRSFAHPDPIEWTGRHRDSILRALYTILLANPRLRRGSNQPPSNTRFKLWQHLIGSAVEHAAELHVAAVETSSGGCDANCRPVAISFSELFLSGEGDDEQTSALAMVLEALYTRWPEGFGARDVAVFVGQPGESAIEFKAALEQASGKAIKVVTPIVITWRLKALVDQSIEIGDALLVLQYYPANAGGWFSVRRIR